MDFNFSISKPELLINAINKAPKETLKEIRIAGKRATRDIQEEARTNHRFTPRSGNLDRAIETEHHDRILTWKIGIDSGKAPYGKAVHDGSKAGIRIAKRGKGYFAFKGKDGKWVRKKSIKHPGAKPDPFIVKAGQRNVHHVNKLFHNAVEMGFKRAFG